MSVRDRFTSDQLVRKWKSMTQRILLLDMKASPTNDSIVCKILGASGKTYDVLISINTSYSNNCGPLLASCNCMDAMMRQTCCKHLYWLASKRFRAREIDEWEISDFLLLLEDSRYLLSNIKGRNDQCPICLEYIDYNNENTICCTEMCQNSVHRVCWSRYICETQDMRCVCCRSSIALI